MGVRIEDADARQGRSTPRLDLIGGPDLAPSSRRRVRYLLTTDLLILTGVVIFWLCWFESLPPDSNVHLLFPIDAPAHDVRSCKSLLAAIVNGYDPIIINWDKTGEERDLHVAKIRGVNTYLSETFEGDERNDLILVIDAFDAWIQLPPSVLVHRYRETGESVIVAADQHCWPNNRDDIECTSAPPSPMPRRIWGDDAPAPRWVNSGTVVGRHRAMADLYLELMQSVARGGLASDQFHFNRLISKNLFRIDYGKSLFFATSDPSYGRQMPVRHAIVGDTSDDYRVPVELYPPLTFHERTGELPVVVHFAMAKEAWHDAQWGRVWYTDVGDPEFLAIIARRLTAGKITFGHNGTVTDYATVCPPEVLDLFDVLEGPGVSPR